MVPQTSLPSWRRSSPFESYNLKCGGLFWCHNLWRPFDLFLDRWAASFLDLFWDHDRDSLLSNLLIGDAMIPAYKVWCDWRIHILPIHCWERWVLWWLLWKGFASSSSSTSSLLLVCSLFSCGVCYVVFFFFFWKSVMSHVCFVWKDFKPEAFFHHLIRLCYAKRCLPREKPSPYLLCHLVPSSNLEASFLGEAFGF